MKDVIVLLPGILGSELKKDGKTVWGYSAGALGRALFTQGGAIRKALELPPGIGDADDTHDGVRATALLPDLHLIPKIWKIDGYKKIERFLRGTFDVREGDNYFPFPYDWRLSNRANAKRLAKESHDWLKRWRERGNTDAKLILVAHSMGGLISRYFLEILEGWKVTKALISFGTPYRGSLNAVDSLANGVRKGPLGLIDLTSMARSFPSLYQLLPIYPCYDAGDGEARRVGESAGVPNVDHAMAADALQFHREIEAAIQAYPDPFDRYELFPIVGTDQKTSQGARLDDKSVTILEHELGGRNLLGDGTVPRPSATPIEYSDMHKEMFAATKHGSLQNDDPTLVQLKAVITGFNLNLGDYRGPGDLKIGLDVEDVYFDSEAIVAAANSARSDLSLTGTIVNRETNKIVHQSQFEVGQNGSLSLNAGTLKPGTYLISISGQNVEPVSDTFIVVETTHQPT
jgi:pimeloyl-ACP methyl ester carboxylesterase